MPSARMLRSLVQCDVRSLEKLFPFYLPPINSSIKPVTSSSTSCQSGRSCLGCSSYTDGCSAMTTITRYGRRSSLSRHPARDLDSQLEQRFGWYRPSFNTRREIKTQRNL